MNTENQTPPPAADGLDAVMRQAQAVESANALPDPGQEQAQQQAQTVATAAQELFGALQMLRMMAAPMMGWWRDFGTVWSDQTLQGIAEGGAQVMERHGWTLGDAWGQFGPYIALIGAALPPSLVTWQAIQQHRAEQRRPPQVTRPAPPPQGEGGPAS